ncbi:ABC transporter substrate-binding protein [Nocardioides sp. YIM 152588]|uniref:ABC transporter substrate-binding protein n=1 Tax=Nocardioides sp. YIM 152588 TaxID=3158259 RepID=UPI0032E37E1D
MRSKITGGRGTAIALVGCLALLGACSESGATSPAEDKAASDVADLGEPNEATGSPVKVGFLSEGKTEGIDGTATEEGAQAAVDYANDYLGGMNGHVIELETCGTGGTPSGATACSVKFAKDGVVAVLVGTSGQDHSAFEALDGSGIGFMINNTADPDIMGSDRGFVLNNPLGLAGAQLGIAKDNDVKRGAIVVVDVPSATGPVESLSRPAYEAAGIELDLIPISPQVADPTAQVQQAISSGAEQFTILGSTEFVAAVIKAAKQLGFTGPLVTQVSVFPADLVAGIPGGLEGVRSITNLSKDPEDEDRKTYNAVVDEYGVASSGDFTEIGYQTVTAFLRAVGTDPEAGDAKSVLAVLQKMRSLQMLPLGNGLTFQCGVNRVASFLPGICLSQVLVATLGEDGVPTEEKVFSG